MLEGDKAKKIVEMVWKRYLDFTDAEMVALTHRKGTHGLFVIYQNKMFPFRMK